MENLNFNELISAGRSKDTFTCMALSTPAHTYSKEEQEEIMATLGRANLVVMSGHEDDLAVHRAILGTTGSGMSVPVHSLIEKMGQKGAKVVYVDVKADYIDRFSNQSPCCSEAEISEIRSHLEKTGLVRDRAADCEPFKKFSKLLAM